MTNINLQIDSTKYGGFISYGQGQVSKHKPGIGNQYYKDVYNQISEYNSRKVPYFDDKIRYKTVYKERIVDPINKDNYHESKKKSQMMVELEKYQYSHEPSIVEMMKDNKPLDRSNEETIREK